MKRGEALTLATTWTDPQTTMLSERSQTQKDIQGVIPLMGNVQNRQIHRHREWVPGCQGLGRGWRRLMGTGFLLEVKRNVLKLTVAMAVQL